MLNSHLTVSNIYFRRGIDIVFVFEVSVRIAQLCKFKRYEVKTKYNYSTAKAESISDYSVDW